MTTTPYDDEAERQMLGQAMLRGAPVADRLVESLPVGEFYRPAHQRIAQAIKNLTDAGIIHFDVAVVADELGDELAGVGGVSYLNELIVGAGSFSNIDRYISTVRTQATLRRVQAAALEMTYMVDEGMPAPAVVDRTQEMVAAIELPGAKVPPSPGMVTFLDSVPTEYDWVVPGLLERKDRLLLTAGEGVGKSTLLRQMAVQIAAGIHPFDLTPIEPKRVLLVDVENSDRQIARKLTAMFPLVPTAGILEKNFLIEVMTRGLDLIHPADQAWLLGKVEAARPDILVMGPVYKLHSADPNKEEPAKIVADLLDRLRDRYGVTMMIETHSPHGAAGARPLRPFGASLWRRWPEFGYGLAVPSERPDECRVLAWRGPRDDREWPTAVVKSNRPTAWPWLKIDRGELERYEEQEEVPERF